MFCDGSGKQKVEKPIEEVVEAPAKALYVAFRAPSWM